jgi:hypothetical protein
LRDSEREIRDKSVMTVVKMKKERGVVMVA